MWIYILKYKSEVFKVGKPRRHGIVWKYHVDHLKLLQETSAKVVPYSSQVQQDDTELLITGGIE